MSSKNNPENRGRVTKLREYNGKVVKPTYYFGKHRGHGNYIAAAYESGDLVLDPVSKRPIPYQKV